MPQSGRVKQKRADSAHNNGDKQMRTTAKERAEVIARLIQLGISYHDAEALRRISKTLHSWFEQECGDSNGHASWSIERDEKTDKPFRCVYPHYSGEKNYRIPIPDREAGAKRRLALLMKPYSRRLVPYIQGDCRGASVYILRKQDVRGQNIDSIYTRGVAVY
jgi:hypothetical protein